MRKNYFSHPVLVYMYGLPGSGKTFVARQLSEALGMAHISSNRLRSELFDKPRHNKDEYLIITHLMDYMAEQFLNSGVSVIYDISVNRLADRRVIRDMAQQFGAKDMMIWIQIDADSAWQRTKSRDRRKADDKYSNPISREAFDKYLNIMQNPQNENYLVISGKHSFDSQKTSVLRRLREMGVLSEEAFDPKFAKPELINLVSRAQAHAGRVDYTRRNVIIR